MRQFRSRSYGIGFSIVSSGASTGEHEAWELRDAVKDRWGGKGVTKAVANVNKTIVKEIQGMDACDQVGVDKSMLALDGTKNNSASKFRRRLPVQLKRAKLPPTAEI